MKFKLKNIRFVISFSILLILSLGAMFANLLAPFDPFSNNLSDKLCEMSFKNLLGCDVYGGDVLSKLLFGLRTSLSIAFLSVFVSNSLGFFIGALCGYFRGGFDFFVMRIVDILMAFPGIMIALVLSALLGPSFFNIIIAISFSGWCAPARLIRAQTLSLKEKEFCLAANVLGASFPHILFKHLLPFLWAPLVIISTFSLAGVILVESSLSFLGLGPQGAFVSLGELLSQGKSVLIEAPGLSFFPGCVIFLLVMSLNFLGDALRDYLSRVES